MKMITNFDLQFKPGLLLIVVFVFRVICVQTSFEVRVFDVEPKADIDAISYLYAAF